VRVRGYPSQYPYTTPHCKAFYVGAENGLGIGEGVPIAIRCRGGPYQGQGVGTVWAAKESFWSPGAVQAPSFTRRASIRRHPARRPGRHTSQRYASKSGGPEGETSTRTWARLLPGDAAGRLGVPRRSISCSRSLTAAPTREARWAGSRPGATASAWTVSSSRLQLRTIRPGRVSRAADRIVSFLASLLARLCGLALGATLSSLGMT